MNIKALILSIIFMVAGILLDYKADKYTHPKMYLLVYKSLYLLGMIVFTSIILKYLVEGVL